MSEQYIDHSNQRYNDEIINELQIKLAQVSAMMNMTVHESLSCWNDEIKENYLSACSEMVDQARKLADQIKQR